MLILQSSVIALYKKNGLTQTVSHYIKPTQTKIKIMKKPLLVLAVTLFTIFSYSQNELEKEKQKIETQKSEIKKPEQIVQSVYKDGYVEILSGSHSHFDTPTYIVIKSTKELKDIYATLNKTTPNKHEIPNIDFSKEVIVGLFMGSKKSDGYAIKINRILSDGNYTSILIRKIKPTEITTPVITQPFYIAKIVKPTTPIRFVNFL